MPKPSIAPEELDFVSAIRTEPASDAPRLAYAQWLLARGNPRGRFIEVQCELATMQSERTARREALLREERGLVEAHGAAWAQRVGIKRKSLPWTRGFVERLEVPGNLFAKCGPRLFDLEPLSALSLGGATGEQLAAISRMERLATLHTLEVSSADAGMPWRDLFAGDRLQSLRRLRLFYVSIGDDTAGAIASARSLSRLEELELTGTRIGEDGLRWLAHSPALASLRSFVFGGDLTDAAADAFFGGPLVQRIDRLSLLGQSIPPVGSERPARLGDRGAELLARSVSPSLRELHLSGQYLSGRGLEAIATKLPELRELAIGLGSMRPDDLRLLADAAMPSLESFSLLQHDLDDDAVDVVARARGLVRTTDLALSSGAFSAGALRRLGDSELGSRLRSLDLRTCGVDAAGVSALVQTRCFGQLRRLVLDHCPIGDDGARSLASASAPRLASLDLYWTSIADDGAVALAQSAGFPSLERIDLRRNAIGAVGALALLGAPPLRWVDMNLRDNPLGEGVLAADGTRPFRAAS